jgi:hypothetical protein
VHVIDGRFLCDNFTHDILDNVQQAHYFIVVVTIIVLHDGGSVAAAAGAASSAVDAIFDTASRLVAVDNF